ncbi:hypothetical protein DVA86_03260 [Streptomyces armeniacus]|uniref:Uncharacterized protein n=1 Tax=Streptomyces armeniacus TaxID=83291 RepID=A0A345XJJ2_9ACTN|nr:hypothetical protein [Streptomyces armeniacus]AXK31808.1 hypothetical protein DVA86_03260 [Streptomyces armeniacus]
MRFDRTHPALGRGIGFLSAAVLVASLRLLVTQIAAKAGAFTPPLALPVWLNVATVLAGVAASTERALRLRYSRLLDGAAG